MKNRTDHKAGERLFWAEFPSWRQFAWLYLMAVLVGLRGLLFLRYGFPGGGTWMAGSVILLGCAAILRYWGRYELSGDRVLIRNGYTKRVINGIPLDEVLDVQVWEGPLAKLLGIGSVAIKGERGRLLLFRGLTDPNAIRMRIEAARALAVSQKEPGPTAVGMS
jgi:membrane protein YdbS with pleckstrin-like domain